MNLVACDGSWQHLATGEVVCDGVLQIVANGGPFGLPAMTYADANMLIAAIGGVWASVFLARQAFRLLR